MGRSSAPSDSPPWWCTPPAPATARSPCRAWTPTRPPGSATCSPARSTRTTMTSPSAERRLHPWSWLFVLLQQLRQFIVPLGVLLFVGGRSEDRYLLWPLVGVGALVVSAVWQYFTYRYRVDEDRLVVRDGVFERNVRQVPFARIHNVALHQ